MLSKSSARYFFIGGTTLFSLIFLGLTVDTVRQAPERTNAHKLSEPVARGKLIWDQNNCMGCHTLLGEGAYYAPELTKVYERRGAAWMKVFLKDPQAMFPGQRKMVQYNFKEQEIEDLIAFFQWIGEMDLNGFPKKPYLAVKEATQTPVSTMPSAVSTTTPKVFQDLCVACHQLNGHGGTLGPALDGVGQRMSTPELATWLKDPNAVKPGTTMPTLGLSDIQIQELALFLSQTQ